MPQSSKTSQGAVRRSNEDRSRETRVALLQAARGQFVADGYAATSTPDIAKEAGVTRGALYHHFADKEALLKAVVRQEAKLVGQEIEEQASETTSALQALTNGAMGYFAAMSKPGRARLLLEEGPSVLGLETMAEINSDAGTASLRDGLAIALQGHSGHENMPLDQMAEILGAGFDRAALGIAQGEPTEPYQRAFELLFSALIGQAEK